MKPEETLMAVPKIKLAQFLHAELSKKNITLSKLAKDTKIPLTCLFSWKSGVSPRLNEKNLQYLERLSNYFSVSVQKILFGSSDTERNSEILFESIFRDGKNKYRLKIEKIS